MRALILSVLFMLVAGITFAADIDGNWEGNLDMGGQSIVLKYTFKADGTTLTGSTKGQNGNDIAITDGKIDGNNFSFSVDVGMGMPFTYKGEVKGDTITMKMEMSAAGGAGGPPAGAPEMPPTILKKVK
jgi:hypothetical protein